MKELKSSYPISKLKCGFIIKYYEPHRTTIGRVESINIENWLDEEVIRTVDMVILSYDNVRANPVLVNGHAINNYNITFIDKYLTDEEFFLKYPEYFV